MRYEIKGRPVPSVTEIIRAVIPGQWLACDPWYLERGTAVHACMEMIAKGKEFDCDPRIQGFVDAGLKWFADMNPTSRQTELRVENAVHQYAGRLDMLCEIGQHRTVVDFKTNNMDAEIVMLQLGGYAACLPKSPRLYGMGVELHEDGTYKVESRDLRKASNEFLALRTVYGVMQRLGKTERKDNGQA